MPWFPCVLGLTCRNMVNRSLVLDGSRTGGASGERSPGRGEPASHAAWPSPTFALGLEETATTPSPWESQLLFSIRNTLENLDYFFLFCFFFFISISCGADRLGYMVLILQLLCCCGSVRLFISLLIPKFYLLESKWVSQGKLYLALTFLNDCLWKHFGQLYFWLPPWSSDTIISFFTVRLPPHFIP